VSIALTVGLGFLGGTVAGGRGMKMLSLKAPPAGGERKVEGLRGVGVCSRRVVEEGGGGGVVGVVEGADAARRGSSGRVVEEGGGVVRRER
jgi:hypothetical protein